MSKQLLCPFCGGKAIVLQGESAERYCSHKKEMPHNARLVRKIEYPSKKFYEYKIPTFTPKCLTKGCIGRSVTKYFRSEEEAIEAWNRRAGDDER